MENFNPKGKEESQTSKQEGMKNLKEAKKVQDLIDERNRGEVLIAAEIAVLKTESEESKNIRKNLKEALKIQDIINKRDAGDFLDAAEIAVLKTESEESKNIRKNLKEAHAVQEIMEKIDAGELPTAAEIVFLKMAGVSLKQEKNQTPKSERGISEEELNKRMQLAKDLREVARLREEKKYRVLTAIELAFLKTAGTPLNQKKNQTLRKTVEAISEEELDKRMQLAEDLRKIENQRRNQEYIENHHKERVEDAKKKQENVSEAKTQETPKTSEAEVKPERKKEISEDVLDRARFLNLSKKDLEKNSTFSSFSDGKQALVLEQLRQMAAENAKSNAAIRQQESYKKSGLFGKFLKNFTKESERIKFEREEFAKMAGGGANVYGKDLDALSVVAAHGPEVWVGRDGKFKIKYLSEKDIDSEEKINDQERLLMARFNNFASIFSNIPEEYSFKTASKKERAEYEKAYDEYEKAKRNMMETMKEKGYDESDIFLRFNKLENDVKLNQFLNTNKDVEKYISDLNGKNRFLAALTSGGAEKASYGAAGYIARTAAIGAFGAVGAPLGAALFGGVSSGIRARRELLNREKASRKGVEHKGEEDRNFVSVGDLFKKLDDLGREYYREEHRIEYESSEELSKQEKESQLSKIKERLTARIRYTQEKLDAGLVNFGKGGEVSVNRFNLIAALSMNIARTGISSFSDKSLSEIKELTRGRELREVEKVFKKGELSFHEKSHMDLLGIPYRVIDEDKEKALKEEKKNLSIEDRMRSFLDFRNEAITLRQKNYISRQAVKGAAISAGFALGGYMIRHYAGEWFGGGKGGAPEASNSTSGGDPEVKAVSASDVGLDENITTEKHVLGAENATEKVPDVKETLGSSTTEKDSIPDGMILDKEVVPSETTPAKKLEVLEFASFRENIKNRLEEMLGYNFTDENYIFKDGQHIIKDFQEKGFSLVLKTGENGEIKFGVNGPAALGRYNFGESGKSWFFKPDADFDQVNLEKAKEFIKKANDSFYKGPSNYSGDPYDISGDGIRK